MKILDRYVFRETLIPSMISLLALTFVMLSRDIGSLLEVMVRQSATLPELWAISMATLPNVLTFTIPMAVLVGILTGFGRMSSDSEAIALRAAGVSMKRILRPVMLLGLLSWTITLGLSVWVAPRTAARLRHLVSDIQLKRVSLELKPRVFNESVTNLVLYAQDIAPDGLNWRGILLADMTKPDEPRVTFARSGTLRLDESNQTFQLTLTNGTIVSPLAASRYADVSSFETTTIPIPLPQKPGVPDKPIVAQAYTRYLWDRLHTGLATYEEQLEFHKRLALPFACLAFALVALPLGVSTTRGSKSIGLVISLTLMLIYYLVFIGGTRIATNAGFSPLAGAWIANFGFAILGVVLLIRSDHERENRILGRLAGIINGISERLGTMQSARKRLGRWAYSLTHHPKFFRVLDIYVLRGFWFFFVLILVVFIALFIIVTLFELLPDIVKNNVPAAIVVNYFVYLLPQIVYWVLPLTVLLAILINLGTLTKTNEILAVKAGAVSLYRMTFPLLLMGLLLSTTMYFLQDFGLPYTNQRQDEYRNVIKGKAPQTYRDPNRKWMVGTDNHIYYYNYFDPDLNLFGGLSIFGFEPNTLDLKEWVFAARGSWDNRSWVLEDGSVRKLGHDGAANATFPTRFFPEMDTPEYFKKEVRTAAQMTYNELRKYVNDLRQSGFDVSALTVDLNRKLSFPLVSFIMVIIGIPFSFTTGKKGAFYGIGLCIAVGIFYWSAFELFDKLGGINKLSPLIAAWFPNLIFGFSGLWMMLRVKT